MTNMKRWRGAASLMILIADAGFVAWGAMADPLPDLCGACRHGSFPGRERAKSIDGLTSPIW
jgi:hypothetical protein